MGKGGGSQKDPYEKQAAKILQEQYSRILPLLGGTGEPIYGGQRKVQTQTGIGEEGEPQYTTTYEDIYTPTTRSGLLGKFMDLTEGVYDPTQDPGFRSEVEAGRSAISRAYRGTEDELLSKLPRGGGLDTALAENITGRNTAISDFINNLTSGRIRNLEDVMTSLALGAPYQSAQGLTSAGSVQANRYAADQARAAGEKQAFADTLYGVGYGIGGK